MADFPWEKQLETQNSWQYLNFANSVWNSVWGGIMEWTVFETVSREAAVWTHSVRVLIVELLVRPVVNSLVWGFSLILAHILRDSELLIPK